MAGGLGNRSKAKFGHVQSVLCARCDGGVGFYGLVSQRTDFFVFCAKNDISRKKKPIASASANRAVHQRTECEKKHNRAPNRVPIREILAARRGVAYSCESGGAWGHLRRRGTIQQMVPRVPFGPSGGYGVLLFTFLHIVHGVSLRGSVSVGSGVSG